MSCSNPILAIDNGFKFNENGVQVRDIRLISDVQRVKVGIEELKAIHGDKLLLLPCGHCYMCSLDYARMWASRIMLETKAHQHNCFITLTYADCFLPGKLEKKPFQLFIKRLRKELDCKIRYFGCGEIGEGKGSREGFNPHFHICIFGYDFPDKVELKRSGSGLIIYRSPLLEKLWPYGMSSIGDVNPQSAQYVAKYSMKRKISGVNNGEFVLMSRRPGIGINGYDPGDYRTDKLYINGRKYKMPRYFDKLTEKRDLDLLLRVKDKRISIGRSLTSKKFLMKVSREEFALHLQEEERIRKDCFKRRLLV